MSDTVDIIADACGFLLKGEKAEAEFTIKSFYPFTRTEISKRSYNDMKKMTIYIRDGFIDRYNGKRLLSPGILRILSAYFPETVPYQPHWKMTETHMAYWELMPTIDHIEPIARGGVNSDNNLVTTSMLNNSIKTNWTVEQLGWKVYEPGNIKDWDGLSGLLLRLVDKDTGLLTDRYISTWHRLTRQLLE